MTENPAFAVDSDRRTFLRRAGLVGVGVVAASAGMARPFAHADETLGAFPHGVASGDPLADRVVLWTRVTPAAPGSVEVTWRVARDLAFTDVVATDVVTTDADQDHTVKVDPTGLAADTYYFYDFAALGSRSIVGRTKTTPATGAAVTRSLRLGIASCSNYTGGFFNSYATMARRNDLDAVVHVGDYIYEYGDGSAGRSFYGPGTGSIPQERIDQQKPDGEITTLADYRLRHGTYKLDPDLRRLHQLFPFVTIWDDHESANNSRRDSAQNHTFGEEGTDGTWHTRKDESRRAYVEWMPIRAADPAIIYRSFRYGDLMDLIMLDTRLEDRDDEIGSTVNTVTTEEIDDPERRLISPTQQTFLQERLSAPGAQWKVIGQQVILGQWNLGGVPTLPGADAPQFVLREDGNAINPDQWDGYTAERDRLFAHIRGGSGAVPRPLAVDNVVVLTGDVHTSWALDLHENPKGTTEAPPYEPLTGTNALGVEFVTPSITSANFESLGPAGVAAFEAEARNPEDNPHVKYVDFASHGYYVLDVNRERVQADWYYIDTVTEPSDNERLGASWRVLDGVNHLDQTASYQSNAPGPAAAGVNDPPVPAAGSDAGPAPVVPEIALPTMIPIAGALIAGVVALRNRRAAPPENA